MDVNAKIRMIRKEKGYTLDQLALLTGFTKGYLSKIERSGSPPPFATVQKIAGAMQLDMIELLHASHELPGTANLDLVCHTADVSQEESVYSFVPLVNSYRDKQMSPFLFRVNQGETEHTVHDSEEFVFVTEGTVDLHYEGQAYPLARGDSFYLDARIRHFFVNRHEEPAFLVAVHFNYRRF